MSILFFFHFILKCRCLSETHNIVSSEEGTKTGYMYNYINSMAEKMDYSRTGWIDFSKLRDKETKDIDLRLVGGVVICNKPNKVAKIIVQEKKLLYTNDLYTRLDLYVEFVNLDKNAIVFNPLPVILEKYSDFFEDSVGGFPKGFEAYIICVEKGDEAFLVPTVLPEVNFVDGPWRAVVDIELYKNPLVRFGRMYRITILDNIDVLKEGKRYFFWPIPLSTMADVYDFHMAMKSTKKGKFCEMRREENGNMMLICDKWCFKLEKRMMNAYLGIGFTSLNAGMMLASSPDKILNIYYTLAPADPNDPSPKAEKKVYYSPDLSVVSNQNIPVKYQDTALKKFKRATYWVLTDLIYILGWVMANTIFNMVEKKKMLGNLKKINEALIKAPFAYPWRLSVHPKHERGNTGRTKYFSVEKEVLDKVEQQIQTGNFVEN